MAAAIRQAIEEWVSRPDSRRRKEMETTAYHSEWEETYYHDDRTITACITYPVIVTDDHPACSYGQLVVVIEGEPRGPLEMPAGELLIPDPDLAARLGAQGYRVVPYDALADYDDAAADYAGGLPLDGIEDDNGPVTHWHPAARVVQY